jgi:hypothetical protein
MYWYNRKTRRMEDTSSPHSDAQAIEMLRRPEIRGVRSRISQASRDAQRRRCSDIHRSQIQSDTSREQAYSVESNSPEFLLSSLGKSDVLNQRAPALKTAGLGR